MISTFIAYCIFLDTLTAFLLFHFRAVSYYLRWFYTYIRTLSDLSVYRFPTITYQFRKTRINHDSDIRLILFRQIIGYPHATWLLQSQSTPIFYLLLQYKDLNSPSKAAQYCRDEGGHGSSATGCREIQFLYYFPSFFLTFKLKTRKFTLWI
jgi:hypothetical protein